MAENSTTPTAHESAQSWCDEDAYIIERIAERISKLLERFVLDHPLSPQLLYTRKQACVVLATSMSTLKLLIDRGDLRVRRWGSSVLISHEELERISKRDINILWPEKTNGKTGR